MESGRSSGWAAGTLSRRRLLRSSAVGAAGLGAAALIGCSSGGDSGSPTAAPGKAGGTPTAMTRKKGGVLRSSVVGDPPGWGLFQAAGTTVAMSGHSYDKLLDVKTGPGTNGYNVELIPQIAQALPETPDSQTYVFKIRQGVKFHNVAPVNGRPMTAADVKQSIDTLRGNKQWQADYAVVTSTETPDANTLVIKTSKPYAPLLNFSAGHYGWRIHPNEIVDNKLHEQNAIGTGPYIRSEWIQGSRITFKKNPDYWDKDVAHVDELQVLVIPDLTSSAAAFRTKQLDLLTVNLAPSQKQDLEKQVPDAKLQKELGNSGWIAMNTTKPPFNDVRVRQALGLLYNRPAEVASVYLGEADPQGTALLPHPDALKPKDIPDMAANMKLDVAEAKKLLAAAGFANGFKTEIVMSPQYTSNVGYQDSLERYVGDLKAGGIEATIRSIEYGVWIASVYRPPYNFDGILWGPGRYYADPDPYVAYWLHPKGITNQSRVNDPTLTALIEKQAGQINAKERWETLREIQRVEAKNVYYVWRVVPQTTLFAQSNVQDFQRHEGYDQHEFWHVWLS